MNVAVLDATLGDNGKGHLAHHLSKDFDWCIRHAGSGNCGHVIYRDGKKYNHHLLPSADYRIKNLKSFLASGMFINLEDLYEEVKLAEQDFPGVAKTIYVDPEAFVITDEHIAFDKEKNKHIGSTGKGVSPAAVSKYARTGKRIYHYINDNAEIIQKLLQIGVHFEPLLKLRPEMEKSNLIFEGNQGALLDINAGLYPYVTAGDCTVSGIYSSGFHFVKLDKVYGMCKPYITKSGEGPFPSEFLGPEAEALRNKAGEFGNTTGRARRVGALDLVMTKYGCQKAGITHLAFIKMDIMDGHESIKICDSYGKEVYSPDDFNHITPTYTTVKGWKNSKNQLEIKPFVDYVEQYLQLPIEFISTGVQPSDIVQVRGNPLGPECLNFDTTKIN